jgi:hypothetical protein
VQTIADHGGSAVRENHELVIQAGELVQGADGIRKRLQMVIKLDEAACATIDPRNDRSISFSVAPS